MKRILNIFTETKQKDNFFNNLKVRNYEKTPIFAFIFAVIIFVNIISFILGYIEPFSVLEKEEPFKKIHLLFGASQSFLILNKYHFWRIFIFPFFQDVYNPYNAFFSLFFVFLTFRTLGFYFEIFFKSKKTLLFFLIGIPTIGLIATVFPISDDIFLFGSEWICWLMIGGFLFLISVKKELLQAISLIKWTIFKISLILIFILIYRYTSTFEIANAPIKNVRINLRSSFFVLMPIITIGTGFFIMSILHFDSIQKSTLYISSFMMGTIFVLIFIFFVIYYFPSVGFSGPIDSKTSEGSETTRKIVENLKEIFKF